MPPKSYGPDGRLIDASSRVDFLRSLGSSFMPSPSYCLVLLLLVANVVVSDLNLPGLGANDPTVDPNEELDECEACVSLTKSFEKGLERTKRGKHEGGDTSWEEGHLKNYVDSEVRLVEIQDELCNELSTGKDQCLSMAENGEQHIEEWWFEHRNKNIRLHDYLCISKLKKCCPEGTFGPKCQKCPDCGHHGKCDGSGTRAGSGKCNCNQGYRGDFCDKCDDEYYASRFGSEDQFECLRCYKACKNGCLGPTSANCTDCAPGYSRDPKTNHCNDINECELGPNEINIDSKRLCKDGTFCENTDGHYKCSPCHQVCETCLDFGPDKCLSCASDYQMDENHTCIHFSDQSLRNSDLAHFTYLVMELMALVVLNYCTTKLTLYLIRTVGFRRIDFFDDVVTGSILRLSLSLPIAIVMSHLNSHGFIRRYVTYLNRSIINLFQLDENDADSSLVVDSNTSQSLEL